MVQVRAWQWMRNSDIAKVEEQREKINDKFDIPIDVETEALGAISNHVNNDIDDDSLGVTDLDYIPPLNKM
ncbi:hypothetical protein RYX36_003623 [Vicia faba]